VKNKKHDQTHVWSSRPQSCHSHHIFSSGKKNCVRSIMWADGKNAAIVLKEEKKCLLVPNPPPYHIYLRRRHIHHSTLFLTEFVLCGRMHIVCSEGKRTPLVLQERNTEFGSQSYLLLHTFAFSFLAEKSPTVLWTYCQRYYNLRTHSAFSSRIFSRLFHGTEYYDNINDTLLFS
jgi:hypothetical protein